MLTMDFVSLIWLQLGFMLLALIWKFDFPPFMVLIIAILNDGVWFFPSRYLLAPCRGVLSLHLCASIHNGTNKRNFHANKYGAGKK